MLTRLTDRCFASLPEQETDRSALGYIRGDRLSLQIDGGNSPAHLNAFRRDTAALGLVMPAMIALTHSHWDHTYGLCAAKEPVICCRNTQEKLMQMETWAWDIPSMEERVRTGEDILFCHEHILAEYAHTEDIRVRRADMFFEDKLMLDLGGVSAELLRLTNSHADDCAVILVPEERVIYLGDITYEDLHHAPVCYHRRRFQALTDSLKQLDFDIAVPGHSLPVSRKELFDDLDSTLDEAASEGVLILDD